MQSQRQTFMLVIVIVACFGTVIVSSRHLDAKRLQSDAELEQEKLYVTGATAKRMSLSFNGLVADWYWMNSLQYVGNKIFSYKGDIQIDDLKPLNLNLLYPLLDNAVTLDPQFMAVYEYGAVVLPTISIDHAIRLTKKGIAANPDVWQLYHQLGFIYWKSGDFKLASQTYLEGSKLPNAPEWMRILSARLDAEGGSRNTARAIFTAMFEQSDDPNVRELAARRLLQIESFDERDAIRKALLEYNRKNKVCPLSWRDAGSELRAVTLPSGKKLRFDANGSPVDPSDAAYLIQNGCNIDLDSQRSKVPYK